jgi:hypothetical protein
MNVGDILTASARVQPDRTALVWDEGGGRRTHRELNAPHWAGRERMV